MEMIEHPHEFTPPRDAFVNSRITDDSLDKLYRTVGIREIEEKIGYKFKEKSFLLQAFTHSSDSENTATESYEQLEYLGDGVLDYIVTCYIFTKGLHGNILYSAPAIRAKIAEYVSYRLSCLKSKDGLMLLNETEPPTMEEVEVPKVLGDVFEALIGAVYLDSGHDLHTVWKVYQGFNPEIDAIMADPPRNPKKLLHEHFQNIEFGKAEVRDHNVRIQVTLSYKGKTYRFAGLGNNRKQAEIAASKCALKNLNKRMYQKIIQ